MADHIRAYAEAQTQTGLIKRSSGKLMNLLAGKRGIIFGVANDKSIAWGIAQQAHKAGAQLAFTYHNDSVKSRVQSLAASLGSEIIMPCDVNNEEDVLAAFKQVYNTWGCLDFVVHSVAFANRDDLRKPFSQTSYEGFDLAMRVSTYSLVSITRNAIPYMTNGGSIVTLTYLGSQKTVPNYNVMGVAKAALESSVRYLAAELGPQQIRVNAISAGPIRTLAASGIPDFKEKIKLMDEQAPLRRKVTQCEVGKTAVYFLSGLSSGVTGEIHYVDGGFNITAAA